MKPFFFLALVCLLLVSGCANHFKVAPRIGTIYPSSTVNRSIFVSELDKAKAIKRKTESQVTEIEKRAADYLKNQVNVQGNLIVQPLTSNVSKKREPLASVSTDTRVVFLNIYPRHPAKRMRVDIELTKDRLSRRLPLWFAVIHQVPVIVSRLSLPEKSPVSQDDFEFKNVDVLNLPCLPIYQAISAAEYRTTRSVREGELICANDLEVTPLIDKAQPITLIIKGVGFHITSAAVSLEQGFIGDTIEVNVLPSQRSVAATIIDKNTVYYENDI